MCQQCPACGDDRHEGLCRAEKWSGKNAGDPGLPWCRACQSYHHPDNPTCRAARNPDKDFGEIVAEMINHGLSDREIFDQLVEGYGYDSVVEDLVAHIRVLKSRLY